MLYKTSLRDKTKELMEKAYQRAFEAESKRTADKTIIRRAAEEAAWKVGVRRQKEDSQNIDDWIDRLTRRFFSQYDPMIESATPENLLDFPLTEQERKYAPDRLYYKGNPELLRSGYRVSVVGTRKASPEGLSHATEISQHLVKEGFVVVSGLARGIDTAAHTAAIESGGSTIAVLGTPVDQYSTAANRQLQETIGTEHLLVSQFVSGSRVNRYNFPVRNRTMALLSDATIIVEISGSSGTEHQGWEAIRLGRIVLLCQSVFDHKSAVWPKKMIEYGAVPLGRDLDLQQVLCELPI